MDHIVHTSVSDAVLAQMKHMLSTGAWKPGDKLKGENELAREFGISRASVRSSIHQLVGLGVLTVRHGDGTYVSELVPAHLQSRLLPHLLLARHELIDVLEYRLIIESGSAELAARRASDEDICQLRLCQDNIVGAAGDVTAFAKADLAYHNAIAVIAGNSLVLKTTSIIQDIYAAAMLKTITLRGFEPGLHNHSLLTNAIARHDEQAAGMLMRDHIQSVISMVQDSKQTGREDEK